MSVNDTLNISLETHIVDILRPLPSIVPAELAQALQPYLAPIKPATIPYSILQNVSQWSRTTHGLERLQAHSPPLEPSQYSMISMLSGTITSPERKFGAYTPAKDPQEVEAEKQLEKKKITALLNALLSIGGSGVATWWIADKTGWKNEWRALLSLFAALVVAVSEAVLYIIWSSRRSSPEPRRVRSRHTLSRHKKDDGDTHPLDAITARPLSKNGLRRRQ